MEMELAKNTNKQLVTAIDKMFAGIAVIVVTPRMNHSRIAFEETLLILNELRINAGSRLNPLGITVDFSPGEIRFYSEEQFKRLRGIQQYHIVRGVYEH